MFEGVLDGVFEGVLDGVPLLLGVLDGVLLGVCDGTGGNGFSGPIGFDPGIL